MKLALFVIFSCAVLQQTTSKVNYVDIFNKIQTILRAKDEVFGEGEYECYESGACVMEYKVGDLVTFREEALCARSAEGCGLSINELQKREQQCTNMEEEYMQLCRRSDNENCGYLLESMEEMQCSFLKLEKRGQNKRSLCNTLHEEFEQLCTRSNGKRRAISDGCQAVLKNIEDEECESDLQKRATTCDEGWSKRGKVCYKYYAGPYNFKQALKFCNELTKDKSSHLATPERAVTMSPEDTAFFNELILSAGAIKKIDAVLSQMGSHYTDGDWKNDITYFDNWAWVGIKKVENVWRWVSAKKADPKDWNNVDFGQSDWIRGENRQPSKVTLRT